MKTKTLVIERFQTRRAKVLAGLASVLLASALGISRASTAYGSLSNFDCVNDTGVEAHGFEIELDDIHSASITYTYDWNHYGVPKITEDNTDPLHPRVFVRYAAKWTGAGWSAFTAIPAAPIAPTDGHQFTNPAINFGGEHFGVGYWGNPSAVKYNWLIDDGAGNLVHGPPVYIATPTFNYMPPAPAVPAQVVAVIVQPPPPPPEPQDPPRLRFGAATWVKAIKTKTHSARKIELAELVGDDPDQPQPWANGLDEGEIEVETEWKLLQTEFENLDNPKGILEGAAEELPEGDEVITRRYEFFKYTGPFDAESGEAMADAVAPDGTHGQGSVTFNDHLEGGEWVEATVDLSTVEVVGDFIGAQMSAFDAAPPLGLIDHIPDGEVGVAYADRTVVVAEGGLFRAVVSSGAVPPGTELGEFTGVFSGTPSLSGSHSFTVEARDLITDLILATQNYVVTITDVVPQNAAPVPGADSINRLNNELSTKVLKSALLQNDFDADGDPLTLVAVGNPLPAGATVLIAGNFVVYTAPQLGAGQGSFTYTVSDGVNPGVEGTVTVPEIPANPEHGPNAQSIVVSGGHAVVTFIGVPGHSYELQRTGNLAPPVAWSSFAPAQIATAPANGVFTFTAPASGEAEYYRAVLKP